jgi:hypothetical protein
LRGDSRWISHGGEVGEPHPVRVGVDELAARLHGQARLAAPSRAGQRDQRRFADQLLDRGHLLEAADERGVLYRQVLSPGIERAQRGELGYQLWMAELVDVLGPGEVLQPTHSQVGQAGGVRQGVDHQVVGRLGQHHLAAVSQVAQPGRPVEDRAAVVPVASSQHDTCVQPHSHAQRRRGNDALDGQGRGDGVTSTGEGDCEGIAFSLLKGADAVTATDALVDHIVEVREGCSRALCVGLQLLRDTLHISEQQGDRPGPQQRLAFAHGRLPDAADGTGVTEGCHP